MYSSGRITAPSSPQNNIPDYKERDVDGKKWIHTVIEKDDIKALRALLQKGVSATSHFVDKKTGRSFSPLLLAIAKGKVKCLQELLENGHSRQSVSVAEKIKGLGNVLHVAAAYNQPESLNFLLSASYFKQTRSLLNQKNEKGQTPLTIAASIGNDLLCKTLVEKNLEVLASKDLKGKTALHHAAKKNHSAVCLHLISLGARTDVEDCKSRRPFDLATNPAVKRSLLEAHKKLRDYHNAPPNFHHHPPQNVSYKGGGAKGGVHLGVSEALVELGLTYKRVAGASAGAIKATLDALGFANDEAREIMGNTSFSKFKDYLPGNITVKGGVFKGEKFLTWIRTLILEKTKIENFTFGDLRRKIKNGEALKHLYIYAVRTTPSSELVCFNSECKEWDDLPIAEGVRASMSIPGAFVPYRLNFRDPATKLLYEDPSKSVFVDGGMLKNLPIDSFDFEQFTRPGGPNPNQPEFNKRTLAFNIYDPNEITEKKPRGNYNFFTLVNDLLMVYLNSELLHRPSYDIYRIVNIPSCGIQTMDFDLTLEQKNELIKAGREATHAFFAKEKLFALLDHEKKEAADQYYESKKSSIQAYMQTPNFLKQLLGYPNRKIYIQFLMEKMYVESMKDISPINFSATNLPKEFIEEVLLCSPECLKMFLRSKAIPPLMLLSRLLDLLDNNTIEEARTFAAVCEEHLQDLFRSDERGFKEDYSQEAMDKLFSCNKKTHVNFFIIHRLITPFRVQLIYDQRKSFGRAEKVRQNYPRYKNYRPSLQQKKSREVLLHHISMGNEQEATNIVERYKNNFRRIQPSLLSKLTRKQIDFLLQKKVLDPLFCSQAKVHPLLKLEEESRIPKDPLQIVKFAQELSNSFNNSKNKNNWFKHRLDFFNHFMGSSLLKIIYKERSLISLLIKKNVMDFSTFLYAILDHLGGYQEVDPNPSEAARKDLATKLYTEMKVHYPLTPEKIKQIEEAVNSYKDPISKDFFSLA